MNYQTIDTDTTFINRLVMLDEAAFQEFFYVFSGLVYTISIGLLNDNLSAEDALQETFLKAYKALPGFKGIKLSPWIGKIAQHHCLDKLREAKRTVPCINSTEPSKHLNLAQVEQVSKKLPDFMNSLSKFEREVIILKKIEGLSYKEISQITGKKEGTLRNLLFKSLQVLREEIK